MEVANLSVKLSADVENAISGLRKSDAAIQKSGMVAKNESTKIEGFMGKWKMGWVAMATAAVASLYAIAKSSAVIGAYFSEFGLLIGYVFNEIGIAMEPIIIPILDFLWMLADKFAALPEPVKAAIGIIILIGTAIAVLIPVIGLLAPAFSAGIAIIMPLLAGFFVFLLANPIILIVAAIVVAVVLLYTAWKKNWGGIQEKTTAVINWIKTIPDKIRAIKDEIVDKINAFITWFKKNDWILLLFGPIGAAIYIAKKIYENWKKIKKFTKKTWETIKSITINLWNAIGTAIWEPVQSAYEKVKEYVRKIIAAMSKIPIVGGVGKYISKSIPSFQYGGYVPETGLAMLHAGEHVTSAGGTTRTSSATTINYSPTFYITGEMRSDTNLRELADKLSGIMKDDVRRVIR